ncbi:MAG: hypothetical protein CVT92_03125 [Bacteroidetes bacterium HGW-Bacteroidetes-1]|jgi:ketosteroid isomerase-like protein|nr:MAG: hypothetical protein CVT92_03125 [Bacteroidetes bacterium HGW-Bacteroidetes-1]
MKKVIYFILFFLIFSACKRCPKTENADELIKVENILEKYIIAVENEDYKMVEDLWASGDSTMMLGTDSHERLSGWNAIRNAYRNQFDLISNMYISVHDQFIRVNCTGNTAWFSQRMNYNFIFDSVAHSFEGLRFTGVLEKDINAEWKMVQGHLSVPAHVNIVKKPRQN